MTKAQRILALELFGNNLATWRDCCSVADFVADEQEDSEMWRVYRETHPPSPGGTYGAWVHDTIQLAALELAQRYREGSV